MTEDRKRVGHLFWGEGEVTRIEHRGLPDIDNAQTQLPELCEFSTLFRRLDRFAVDRIDCEVACKNQKNLGGIASELKQCVASGFDIATQGLECGLGVFTSTSACTREAPGGLFVIS